MNYTGLSDVYTASVPCLVDSGWQLTVSGLKHGIKFGPKWGQISPNGTNSGPFFYQISVHFWLKFFHFFQKKIAIGIFFEKK